MIFLLLLNSMGKNKYRIEGTRILSDDYSNSQVKTVMKFYREHYNVVEEITEFEYDSYRKMVGREIVKV